MKDYIVGWISDLFKQKCRLYYPRSDIQDEPPSDNVDRETESTESSVSSKSDISPHALEAARVASAYISNHDFIEYSAVYWHVHLREAGSAIGDSVFEDAVQLYDTNSITFATWFSVYWATKPAMEYPHFTDLTIAMAFEHDMMVPLLLKRRARG